MGSGIVCSDGARPGSTSCPSRPPSRRTTRVSPYRQVGRPHLPHGTHPLSTLDLLESLVSIFRASSDRRSSWTGDLLSSSSSPADGAPTQHKPRRVHLRHSPTAPESHQGPGPRPAGIALAFKLIEFGQRRWHAVNAPHLVARSEPARTSRRANSSNDPPNPAATLMPPDTPSTGLTISSWPHSCAGARATAQSVCHRPECVPKRGLLPAVRHTDPESVRDSSRSDLPVRSASPFRQPHPPP